MSSGESLGGNRPEAGVNREAVDWKTIKKRGQMAYEAVNWLGGYDKYKNEKEKQIEWLLKEKARIEEEKAKRKERIEALKKEQERLLVAQNGEDGGDVPGGVITGGEGSGSQTGGEGVDGQTEGGVQTGEGGSTQTGANGGAQTGEGGSIQTGVNGGAQTGEGGSTQTGESGEGNNPGRTQGENGQGAGTSEGSKDKEKSPEREAKEKAVAEKLKKKPSGVKRLMTRVAIIGLAMLMTAGGLFMHKRNKGNAGPAETPTAIETTVDTGEDTESIDIMELTGHPEFDSRIDGSYEQYDNEGCYDDKEGKFSGNSVANVDAALALIGKTKETATPEEMGAAFEYVAFSQKETAAFVLTGVGAKGFENMTYEQASEKIEKMSMEEKAELTDQLKEIFDNMEYGYGETSGSNSNFYIVEREDGNKDGVVKTMNLDHVKTITMTHTNADGSKEVLSALVRCFNGNKIVVVVSNGGVEEKVEIKTTQTPEPVKPLETTVTPVVDSSTTSTPSPRNPGGGGGGRGEDKPTPKPKPDPKPEPKPEPKPDPKPEPKDYENLKRIDDNINGDISDDIGTEKIDIEKTEKVSDDDKTDKPDDYQGTEPEIKENSEAPEAEDIKDDVSSENKYDEDREKIASKDSEKTVDDDSRALSEISVGTGSVETNVGVAEPVSGDSETVEPSESDYSGGTGESTVIENSATQEAESVQETVTNNYSEDLGGANADNAEVSVSEDNAAQSEADSREISSDDAPSAGTESGSDALEDLGIDDSGGEQESSTGEDSASGVEEDSGAQEAADEAEANNDGASAGTSEGDSALSDLGIN